LVLLFVIDVIRGKKLAWALSISDLSHVLNR